MASGSRGRPKDRSNLARAAVFGISDGLVTNVSLTLGVAGAHPAAGVVRLVGFAALVAGACSMASGEYLSIKAQVEMLDRELEIERQAQLRDPQGERAELVDLYRSRGLRPALAEELASVVMSDPQLALEVHAREELGLDPTRFASPVRAAAASFASFAVGAGLPLLVWFFAHGLAAVALVVALAVATSVMLGLVLARLTGRSPLRFAARQVCYSMLATAVTFGVARMAGVAGLG